MEAELQLFSLTSIQSVLFPTQTILWPSRDQAEFTPREAEVKS